MRFAVALKVSLLCGLLLACSQQPALPPAQRAQIVAQQAQTPPRPSSPPYTGDLARFEEKDRDTKLQVQRVMDVLGIRPGAGVADIGAGSGWFTVRAARRVGPGGAVYAVEINPDFLEHIRNRAQREGFRNIQTILGEEDDPLLPANSVDSVLLLKTYHEVAKPIPLLQNLRKSLRPDARIGIIDRNGKADDHGVDRAVVEEEVRLAGYELVERYDFVKGDGMDYFLVFKAR